jgi:type III restriction enzyme
MSAYDLQRLFDYFVRKSLEEGAVKLYPEDRSVDKVKQSVYKFFEIEFKMRRGDDEDRMIRIVLNEKNIQHFLNVIDKAKEEYIKEVSKRKPEIKFVKNWNIPEKLNYSENYHREDRKKSVMQPFYIDKKSRLEEAFIEFLEKSEKVEWWFKNGDRDATFFAIPYRDGEEERPFYVDFIVMLKDGRIGLFDTKAGFTRQIAGPKIDGLYEYIKKENEKGKNLFGGIVTNTDQKNYTGRWIYYNKTSEELKDNDFSNWEELDL